MESGARRLLLAALLAVGLGLIVLAGLWASTGEPDDVVVTGDVVDQLVPARGDEVLRQARLGIDLAPGWTGVLVINGVEIPEDQLIRSDPLNQVFYQPGEDQEVEQLDAGQNCVTAVVWQLSQSREQARDITWCFDAT